VVRICEACLQPLGINWICPVCGENNQPSADDKQFFDAAQYPALDRLGEWSQLKHEILEQYAQRYTTILRKQRLIKKFVYVDGFSGAGTAVDRASGQLVLGSAQRMLQVQPPFHEYHFIELNTTKAQELERRTEGRSDVFVYTGDCNEILTKTVLPRCRWSDYARGLCLLDPYGLTVSWQLLTEIAEAKSFEIIFNFMIVGANRNVFWKHPERLTPERLALADRVWGDRSWTNAVYRQIPGLFGPMPEKVPNEDVVQAYCERLRSIAGFAYVPDPIPMQNTKGATLYYLIFAGHNQTGAKIIEHIFRRFRRV
jgi:three-Cys-motif partner protein